MVGYGAARLTHPTSSAPEPGLRFAPSGLRLLLAEAQSGGFALLYDAFICHASEDKDDFVRPLAEALAQFHLHIWYDEFSLSVGDSLRRAIDQGLSKSTFGIVVLSPDFFKKDGHNVNLMGLWRGKFPRKGN